MKVNAKTLVEANKEEATKMFIVSDDYVDTCYGMDLFKITPKQLEALKNRRYLYFLENGGEYAAVMFLGEDDE